MDAEFSVRRRGARSYTSKTEILEATRDSTPPSYPQPSAPQLLLPTSAFSYLASFTVLPLLLRFAIFSFSFPVLRPNLLKLYSLISFYVFLPCFSVQPFLPMTSVVLSALDRNWARFFPPTGKCFSPFASLPGQSRDERKVFCPLFLLFCFNCDPSPLCSIFLSFSRLFELCSFQYLFKLFFVLDFFQVVNWLI